jgi:hypothetical protein
MEQSARMSLTDVISVPEAFQYGRHLKLGELWRVVSHHR